MNGKNGTDPDAKVLTNKADIFGMSDTVIREVYVPEWKVTVRVRSLMGFERDDYEMSLIDQRAGNMKVEFQNARARLVALAVVDADGNRLFSDDDIPMLSTKSASALSRLFDAASALSGIGNKDIEELLGKSRVPRTSGSRSG